MPGWNGKLARERRLSPLRVARPCYALVFIALLWLAAAIGRGAEQPADPYLQTVWTTENGLAQNSVNAIVQTRDGYLWLATFGGLSRFDGVTFTTFNTANTPGLKSNRILSLIEAFDGALWAGAETGEVMRFKDGVARAFTAADGLPGITAVWCLRQDHNGAIWAGGREGLALLQGERFKVYTTRDGLPDNQVWALEEDAGGALLVSTNKGLARFDGERFASFRQPEEFADLPFAPFIRRRAGGFWLGARKNLWRYDGQASGQPELMGNVAGSIRALFEDSAGALWVSSDLPKTLTRWQEGRLRPYPLRVGPSLIRSFYEDREGNLWLGSDGGGLTRLKQRAIYSYGAADGLPGESVWSITDDGADGLWLATTAGLAHRQGVAFKVYTTRDGLQSPYITSLCRARDGSLWVGSNYGLTRFKDNRFSNFTAADGLVAGQVNALFEDREGVLWIGAAGGLGRWREGRFSVLRRSDGVVADDARYITQTSDGALWIGTTGGVSRFQDNTFTNYTTQQGLENETVRAIEEDENGAVWLGTYGGGLYYLRADGDISSVTTKNGLFDDFISRILDDGQGNFWILGNRGIFRVSRRELRDFVAGRSKTVSPVSFGIADGMANSEGNGGNQPAGWRTADGALWFPIIRGVVAVNPNITNRLPPQVRIEQAIVDGVAQPAQGELNLAPGQTNLELKYTGISLSRPEQVQFRYRLVGLGNEWQEAGTRRAAYFTRLPPGRYRFEVLADNGDGVWNTEPATLDIVARPPFWRDGRFLALVLICAGGAVFGVYRWRVNSLKRARQTQEEFSRRLINAHESERRRIAGELHDGLGQSLAMIKNSAVFGAQLVTNLRDAQQQFADITEQAALAIAEVRAISHNLRPYLLDRLGLTRALRSMLNKVADNTDLALTFEVDNIDGLFDPEAEMSIYRIAQECLNNTLKHAQASRASVSVKRGAQEISLVVADNGRGFTPDQRRGFGLLGLAERVRMLGGSLDIQSDTGAGTTVSIRIKKEREGEREKRSA